MSNRRRASVAVTAILLLSTLPTFGPGPASAGDAGLELRVIATRDRVVARYDNNARLRKVILSGKPGHRKVEVPPWPGIDSEGWADRYGLGPFVG